MNIFFFISARKWDPKLQVLLLIIKVKVKAVKQQLDSSRKRVAILWFECIAIGKIKWNKLVEKLNLPDAVLL